jgi:hypothetical protein
MKHKLKLLSSIACGLINALFLFGSPISFYPRVSIIIINRCLPHNWYCDNVLLLPKVGVHLDCCNPTFMKRPGKPDKIDKYRLHLIEGANLKDEELEMLANYRKVHLLLCLGFSRNQIIYHAEERI